MIEMKSKGKGIVTAKVQTNANNCVKCLNKKSGCQPDSRQQPLFVFYEYA
jgi:hypothetical protein